MGRDLAVTSPSELTETAVLHWCAGADSPRSLANNTIRSRATLVATFLRWCADHDIPTVRAAALTDRSSPLRQYRPTYGKVQSANPARWLTRDEAFTDLLGAVDNTTAIGLRDEIVLRLGLSGVRAQEIGHLLVGDVQLHTAEPALHWTGKGYKPRRIGLGRQTVALIRRYLEAYADALGHPAPADAPLICRRRPGRTAEGQPISLDYGTGLKAPAASIWNIVHKASTAAGLGHVAPHDLRRSAAGILHRETSPDGAHRFDLLDIQKVLGHADPATTMKCYLDPMDTGVLDRAADLLD